MSLKLSSREKILTFITALVVFSWLFFNVLLGPLADGVSKKDAEVKNLKQTLARLQTDANLKQVLLQRGQITANLLSKDQELKLLVDFTETSIKNNQLKLDALEQLAGTNELGLKLVFSCNYNQLLSFLNSLKQLDSLYVIKYFSVKEAERKLFVDLEIFAPYKN